MREEFGVVVFEIWVFDSYRNFCMCDCDVGVWVNFRLCCVVGVV